MSPNTKLPVDIDEASFRTFLEAFAQSREEGRYVFAGAANIMRTGDCLSVSVEPFESKSDPIAGIKPGEAFSMVPRDMSGIEAEIAACLQPHEIVQKMRVTRTSLMNYRKNMELLGLPQGRQRYVYPAWQLDLSGQPIPEMAQILRMFDAIAKTPLEKLIQLLAPSYFYGGKSVKDCLVAGDLDQAVRIAKKKTMR